MNPEAVALRPPISFIGNFIRIVFYLVAWVAAFYCIDPTMRLWHFAWLFPAGLSLPLLPPGQPSDAIAYTVVAVCWTGYALHAGLFFGSRRLNRILFLYAILIALHAGNVFVWREFIHAVFSPIGR